MKILGIDSSGLVASAALVVDDTLAGEFTVNNKKTHSQTLLPMIDELIQFSGISLKELDAIAVAAGPGSFTGLRIGSSTAKGMALALKLPIVPVLTLAGLAYRLAAADGVICPMMDARRNQVYTALFTLSQGKLHCVREQEAVDIMEILRVINETGQKVTFLGDGVPVHQQVILENIEVPYLFAPLHVSRQSAASVAALGRQYYEEGKYESAAGHKPVYLRKSQAEREREERLGIVNN